MRCRKPRLGAATIFAAAFVSVMASEASLAASLAATLKVGGTGAALGTMRLLGKAFAASRRGVTVVVPRSLGSGGGIRAAAAGALDIGLSSRPLMAKERAQGLKQIAYARTPFVVARSGRVKRPALTSAQLVKSFSGAPSRWPDGTTMRVVLRPEDDSDSRILASAFKGMQAALTQARAMRRISIAHSDQLAMEMAESFAGGLTTATLAAILSEGRRLTPVTIDGVAPTVRNLAKGSYKLEKRLYLVTRPGVRPLAKQFIKFIRSRAGAAILRKSGNLPQ